LAGHFVCPAFSCATSLIIEVLFYFGSGMAFTAAVLLILFYRKAKGMPPVKAPW